MSIAITGIGINTALGSGYDEHERAWQDSDQCYLRPITSFDTEGAKMQFAHGVEDLWELAVPQRKIKKWVGPKDYLAIATAWQAWQDAELEADPFRRAVFVGSSFTAIADFRPYFEDVLQCVDLKSQKFDSARFGSEALGQINPISAVKVLTNGALAHISQSLEAKGPNFNFIDCEQSGFLALEAGVTALEQRRCDVAIIGAVAAPLDPFQLCDDDLQYDLLASPTPDNLRDAFRPGQRESLGRAVGEGACFFVLERADEAKGARTYARIKSVHYSGLDKTLPWRRQHYRSLARVLEDAKPAHDELVVNFNGSPCFDGMVAKSLAESSFRAKCLAPLAQAGDLNEAAMLYQICWALGVRSPLPSEGSPYNGAYELVSARSPHPSVCCLTMSRFGCSGLVEVEV